MTSQVKGQSRVIHGDCLDLLPYTGTHSIDMILSDLPYGVTTNPDDKLIDLEKLWVQFKRVIKPNGVIALTSQFPFTADLFNSNPSWFRYDIIWDKVIPTGFLNANRMPLRSHEIILIFYLNLPYYNPQFTEGEKSHSKGSMKLNTNNNYSDFNRIDKTEEQGNKKYPKSILSFQRPHIKKEHPTQKPVELFEYLIKTFTKEGDTVLDCCAGSGTTGIACERTNRNYILMEKDRDYYNIILSHLQRQYNGVISN